MRPEREKLYGNMPDQQMLEQAQTIKDLFLININDFEASDDTLNLDFALALQAKIDAAIKHPTDDDVNKQISELAASMKEAWKACSTHFQQAKYFIEKAFPANTARHKVFGYSDYGMMTRYQKKVQPFMELFAEAVNKYKTELLAAGYKQQDIDLIPTLTTNFRNAMRALASAKKNRYEVTQTRTTLMNNVWRDIKTINTASKKIYHDNPARLRQYYMPAPAQHNNSKQKI